MWFTDSVSIRLLNIGGYVGKWKVSFFLSSNKIGVDDELKQGMSVPKGTDLKQASHRFLLKNVSWKIIKND